MRVKTFSRLLRSTTYIVLFFFIWTFGPLYEIVAFAAGSQGPVAGSRGPGNQAAGDKAQASASSAAERFEKTIAKLRQNIDKGDVAEMKKRRAEIDALDIELKKEFSATEKKLKDANLPKEILDRHYKFVKHFEDNLAELKTNLDGHEKAQNAQDTAKAKEYLGKVKAHLERTKAPSRHQKLDPNNLPFRARQAKAPKAPRLKKEEFEKDFPAQKSQSKKNLADNLLLNDRHASVQKSKPVLLAFNDYTSDVPLSLGIQLPVTELAFSDTDPILLAQAINQPSADDLAETPEVQFTQDIRDLATNLGNNSLRIFEAIRNNFKFEPYYGSLKGAQQTLREKAGNDFDLASLLISCYRAAGIPARYVVGTISMPLSQAQNWLGLEDSRMVGRLLASAGVPVVVDYTAGMIRLEHVFVQAWVPYQNGRGALTGPGDTWVYMDPSYKETKITQLINQAIPAFDQTQYLSQLRLEDPSEYYSGLVQESLNTSAPGKTVYAVERRREIFPLNLGVLLGTPEYDIVSMGGSFQEIPYQYRFKIALEITDPESFGTSLTYKTSTVALAGKRITLSYGPATNSDQTIVDRYGDIYNTPAYLIKLVPELRLEGTLIAQGLPIGSGGVQPFTMNLILPSGDLEQVKNDVVAGSYYAVAIDLQTVTQNMVFERTQKLKVMNDLIAAGGTATLDDHAGELLYATALTYFQKLDAANRKAQELLKVNDLRGVSEAIISIDVKTVSLFGVTKAVDVSGVHIDVDRDIHLPIPVDGNTDKIKEYNLLIGSSSSYFEHKIIEDIYPTEGISAVKGLQIANQQGVQIQTINRGNVDALLQTLQIRPEIKIDITNAVNAEKEITVPLQEISLNDWRGLGYIVMNPQTGEAAYIISGGLAGGDSTIPFAIFIKAIAMSGNVAADKEIAAIENTVERDYVVFPGPDNSIMSPEALRIAVVDEYSVTQSVTGPPHTQCEGMLWHTYYAPDYDLKAPLLDISSVMNRNLTENITVYDFVGMSGSSSYGRISSGFMIALDYYVQTLKDVGIEPTISSGYRTWYHNCEVPNSVINSNHIDGIAADVKVGGTNQAKAALYAKLIFGPVGGVGHSYATFVHVDLGRPRQW